jgi:hypothetical protein
MIYLLKGKLSENISLQSQSNNLISNSVSTDSTSPRKKDKINIEFEEIETIDINQEYVNI